MIKKVIIPAAGLGTRFLPLSKALPKEMLPLVDRPMISYVVEEAARAGASKVVFVLSQRKKIILEYFKKQGWLEGILEKRNKEELLKELRGVDEAFEGVSFSSAWQEKPLGDGDAILKARKLIGKGACGVLFGDDIFDSKEPVLAQIEKVFRTAQKPVVGLKKVSDEKLSSYGVVDVEKIAHRLYKIKGIIEKPRDKSEAPSNLVLCGRYIIDSDVFDYLKKVQPNEKGEIILAEALKKMIADGKTIYGYEINADWLECGKKTDWMKTNFYLSLNNPVFGKELKEWVKKII